MPAVKLKVAHVSQGGNRYSNDCSQASTAAISCAAIVGAVTPQCPTVDEVILRSGTDAGKFVSVAGFMAMCKLFGVEMVYSSAATLEWLKRQIDGGHVVGYLLDYRPLKKYTGVNYNYAHFSPVIGYDDLRRVVWIADTLFYEVIEVSYEDFELAIGTPSLTLNGTNRPYQAISTKELTAEFEAMGIRNGGVNIEFRGNRNGQPDPDLIDGVRYARTPVKVSNEFDGIGNLDANKLLDGMIPYLKKLQKRGIIPILIFGHQVWGEGRRVRPDPNAAALYDWGYMYGRRSEWVRFMHGEPGFAGMLPFVKPILQRLVDELGINWRLQWWNEQDAALGAVASVPMSASNFGYTYREFRGLARSINPGLKVLAGGHMQGAGLVVQYVKDAMIPENDGIGWHPYTLGSEKSPYLKQHNFEPEMRLLQRGLPGYQIWLTEACGYNQGVNRNEQYLATKALAEAAEDFGVPFIVYPGGEGMHGMAGLWDGSTLVRSDYGTIISILQSEPDIPEEPEEPGEENPPTGGEEMVIGFSGKLVCGPRGLNFRKTPQALDDGSNIWKTGTQPIVLYAGANIAVYVGSGSVVTTPDGYIWRRIKYAGMDGWVAVNASTVIASVTVGTVSLK